MRSASCLLLIVTACATAQPAVERTDEAIDLSGEWNDVDADAVASAIIAKTLGSPWADEFAAKNGRKPVVRLAPVRNKTDAYIDTKYFTKQIEAALLNSGRVEVVSSREEADAMRDERADQAEHASDTSAKTQGNETAADFLMNGWIVSQNDQKGAEEIRTYLTSIEVTHTETNKKAWLGQHRIKKRVTSATE
jgi:PBP1b-binding outer membrane lipoprotein LpoB